MSIVVRQTLYNSHLIKVKRFQDHELLHEIQAFRTYKTRKEEILAGFIPADYQTMNPTIGLKYAVKSNNVFLVKEFIRLGAVPNFNYLDLARVNESYDVFVILCKNLIPRQRWRQHTLFEEFFNAAYWYGAQDKQLLRMARSIPRKYLFKRLRQLSSYWNKNKMCEIAALAYPR